MNDTARTYRRAILAVLAHIQSDLDAPLSLDVLAGVAGFSPFHFHRIFLGLTGETVGAHIRRLRLTRAAHRLEFGSVSVTEIALEAGYEAPEAFTRAFKAQYGEAPSRFREFSRERRKERVGQFFPFPEDFIRQQTGGETMDVSIIRKEPQRVACIRAVGPYMDSSRQAWERMVAWAGPRGLFGPQTRFIGVGHDDPGATAPELLRYDACVSVGPEVEGDDEAFVTELPGGEYATVVHKGPYEGLEKTYMWLYGVWLPQSGRVSAGRPGYEVYLNTPERTPPEELLTEINVPLEPK
ncbi:AraC family transcriptional regulator [Fundidesulfovibrio soli]|uniref:AraC family transcriptional regulator n=1 Tax=Fundidesulfovibrio soli TaxID=2922716 RepID=UPI001FAFC305|nr:AraC family transcriptional regulator [Fundidesulfovibrio soli]